MHHELSTLQLVQLNKERDNKELLVEQERVHQKASSEAVSGATHKLRQQNTEDVNRLKTLLLGTKDAYNTLENEFKIMVEGAKKWNSREPVSLTF